MLNHSKLFPVTDFINKSLTPLPDYTLTLLPSNAGVTYSGVTPIPSGGTVNGIYPTNYLTYGITTDDTIAVSSFSDLAKFNAPVDSNPNSKRFIITVYYGDYNPVLIGLGCKYDELFTSYYDTSLCYFMNNYKDWQAFQIAGVTTPKLKSGEFKVFRFVLSPTDLIDITSATQYTPMYELFSAAFFAYSPTNYSGYSYSEARNISLYTYGVDGTNVVSNKLTSLEELNYISSQNTNKDIYQLYRRPIFGTVAYYPFKWLWSRVRPDNTTVRLTSYSTVAGVTTTSSGLPLGPVPINTTVTTVVQVRNIDAVENRPANGTAAVIDTPFVTTYAVTSIVVTLLTSLTSLSVTSKNTLTSEFSLTYTFKGVTTTVTAFTATSVVVTLPVSLTMACLDEIVFNVSFTPKLKLVPANQAQFAIVPFSLAAATTAANAANAKHGVKIQLKGYPISSTAARGYPNTTYSNTTAVLLGDAFSVTGTVL